MQPSAPLSLVGEALRQLQRRFQRSLLASIAQSFPSPVPGPNGPNCASLPPTQALPQTEPTTPRPAAAQPLHLVALPGEPTSWVGAHRLAARNYGSASAGGRSDGGTGASQPIKLVPGVVLAAAGAAAATIATASGRRTGSEPSAGGVPSAPPPLTHQPLGGAPPSLDPAVRLQNQEATAAAGGELAAAAAQPSGKAPVAAAAPAAGRQLAPSTSAGATAATPGGAAPVVHGCPQTPSTTFLEGTAYGVYDAEGEPSSLDALLASLDSYDVVLLGEYHDDPVAHHLQLRVLQHVLYGSGGGGGEHGSGGGDSRARQAPGTTAETIIPAPQAGEAGRARKDPADALAAKPARPRLQAQRIVSSGQMARSAIPPSNGMAGEEAGREVEPGRTRWRRRPVALSLEMFDRDVQGVMNEYLAGLLTEADLMRDARPWPNYPRDYRPLVLAAKQAGAAVVCANAPRRYVSLVGRYGAEALEGLPSSSRQHLPALPLLPASRQYAAKISWTMKRAREPPPTESEGGSRDPDEEEVAPPLATGPGIAPGTTSKLATVAATPTAANSAAKGTPGTRASGVATGGGTAGQAPSGSPTAGQAPGGSPTAGQAPGGPPRDATTSIGGGEVSGGSGGGACPYIGLTVRSNFVDAQNLWDAAMAASIAGALEELSAKGCDGGGTGAGTRGILAAGTAERVPHSRPEATSGSGASWDAAKEEGGPGPLVVHICGKFHSEQRLGICEHLAHLAPAARVGLVTFVPSGRGVAVDPALLRGARLHTYGDWLVLTDASLPRSFESEHPV